MKKGRAPLYRLYFRSERGDMHEVTGKALLFILVIGAVVIMGPKILGIVTNYTNGAGNTITSTMNS